MASSRIGEQLELRLPGMLCMHEMPWGGRSPRELTAAYKRVTLKAQAAKSTSDFVSDPRQLDLWLTKEKAPEIYSGAPLLRVLPEGSKDG